MYSYKQQAFGMRRLLVVLFLTLSFFYSVSQSHAAGEALSVEPKYYNSEVILNEDDLLVIEVMLGPRISTDTLFIFHSPEYTLLPVQPLMDALEFAVDVDNDDLVINGWFISEEQTVFADFLRQKLLSSGVDQPWPDDLRYAQDGFDLYLDLQTIERWFSLRFNLDVSQLALNVESKQALPLLAKLKREALRDDIERAEDPELIEDYLPNRYAWWGKPQFDVSMGADLQHQRGHYSQDANLVVQGQMDVAKHAMRASYINNSGDSDLRLTFSKASEEPGEHLFLGMDRYQFGDIYTDAVPLLFSSVQGRGGHIERGGNSAQERGSAITIEGDAPPNWEVELYRNGSLVEFTTTTADGRYLFTEVPTFVGENNFEVRIYGPQGQFRVAKKDISIGGAMVKPGAWEYQTYAMERDKHLINLSDSTRTPSTFFSSDTIYGLNEYVSVQAGYSQFTPLNTTDQRSYFYGGLYGSVFGQLANLNVATSEEGDQAISSSIKARLWGTNINLDLEKYSGLISDKNQSGDLDTDLSMRFNRTMLLGLPSSVNVDVELNQKKYRTGLRAQVIRNRLSTGWSGFQFANDLDYSSSNSSDSAMSGAFYSTRKWHDWRFKGGLNYRIVPSWTMNSIVVGASHKADKQFSYQGNVTHSFRGSDVTSFDSTFTWKQDKYAWSLSAAFDTKGAQSLGVSLNTSVGYEPVAQSYYLTNQSMMNNSTVTIRAFLDENDNGELDLGEQPVQGLRFLGRSHWRQFETDAQGYVTLSGVRHLEAQKIEVDDKSIEDPFMQPSQPPVYLYTHTGTNTLIKIPLVQTIEIEGALDLLIAGEPAMSAGISVYLFDQQGELYKQTTTEYDGVYLFDQVLPGSYTVQFDGAVLAKRGYDVPESIKIHGTSEDGVVYIDQIVLSN